MGIGNGKTYTNTTHAIPVPPGLVISVLTDLKRVGTLGFVRTTAGGTITVEASHDGTTYDGLITVDANYALNLADLAPIQKLRLVGAGVAYEAFVR